MCDPRFSSHQLVMLSYTHSMVTMEPQQTHHDTEVVNDRWDIERGSKWWGGGGEEAEETVVRLQLLQGKFTHGMAGRRQKRRQERENMGVKIVFKCVVLDVEKK